MALAEQVRSSTLLFAAFGVGSLAVISRPDGVLASEMWPVGLAAAAVYVAARSRAPLLLVVIGVIGAATFLLGGRPWDVSLVGGAAIALEAGVIAWLLTGRGTRRPTLLDDRDLRRLVVAVVVGALLAGAALGVAAALLTDEPPLLTMAGTVVGHASSALVLLPFLMRTDERTAPAPPVERALQWLVLVAISVLAFSMEDPPGLFLTIPVLAWTALRSSLREAQLQVLTVATIGTVLTTYGFGPLAASTGQFAEPSYLLGIVLQSFFTACVLVVLPLSLAVGQQLGAVERAERESELLRRIIDSAHVAIFGTDGAGRITLFNPGAERMLGHRAEEVLGESMSMFHSREAVSEQAAELGVADDFITVALRLAEPDLTGQHVRFRRKDGTERIHALTLSRVTDRQGRVTGFVGTSEDVTEDVDARRTLEEALVAERLAGERLREVDQVKDTFVSSVSHELRTPITSIVGYLEMLLEGEFGELTRHQRSALRRIDGNSKRLLTLIDELLILSRIHERAETETDLLDLRDVARTAYDVVSPQWAQRNLEVRRELPADQVPFEGNRELLERVLVNLLGNAVKFTPDGGRVALTVAVEGHEAVLAVRDSGIGIPEDEQEKLFTRFFRSSLAQRHAIQGSGLGLSIAQAIVAEHGGRMTVASRPGEETTFRVLLPMAGSRNTPSPLRVEHGEP